MWKRPYEKPLAYYTTHGPSHSYAVENLIYKLIPGFINLREEERFYLLASAWLHDIGMLRSVANELNIERQEFELNETILNLVCQHIQLSDIKNIYIIWELMMNYLEDVISIRKLISRKINKNWRIINMMKQSSILLRLLSYTKPYKKYLF